MGRGAPHRKLDQHSEAGLPDATACCFLHQCEWNPPQVQAPHPCLLIQELISDEMGLFQVHRGACVSVHV